jgi:hypothetical protein
LPLEFRLDPEQRLVRASGIPPLRDEDLTAYQLGLARHPVHGAGFDQIVDLRPIGEALHVTAEGVRASTRIARDYHDFLEGTKLAIVVGGPTVFGMARMFCAYSEDVLDARVFTDFEAAEAWVAGTDDSGSEGADAER